jgi:hydrogenase nickel incorporation protein HypA/HybF
VHEQSLIRALVRQLEEVAAAEGARRITGVRVWCGALSHFTPEHFREHFERAAAGTTAQGAEVDVELSDDVSHPDAAGIRLESVELETV